MERKIEYNYKKGFNTSSKIMEFKLGVNEARLLDMFIYKYNYWNSKKRLINYKGNNVFFITIVNIEVELNMGAGVVKRTIKNLKKSGLINVYRIGIPARNHYQMNFKKILEFDSKYKQEYLDMVTKKYKLAGLDVDRFDEYMNGKNDENSSLSLITSQLGQNDPTREVKMTQLESSKRPVTNNKKLKTRTNNKNIIYNKQKKDNSISSIISNVSEETKSKVSKDKTKVSTDKTDWYDDLISGGVKASEYEISNMHPSIPDTPFSDTFVFDTKNNSGFYNGKQYTGDEIKKDSKVVVLDQSNDYINSKEYNDIVLAMK